MGLSEQPLEHFVIPMTGQDWGSRYESAGDTPHRRHWAHASRLLTDQGMAFGRAQYYQWYLKVLTAKKFLMPIPRVEQLIF